MRRMMWVLVAAVIALRVGSAQGQQSSAPAPRTAPAVTAVPLSPHPAEDAYLRWPLPKGAEKYAAIDGKRMHKYVVEQALIARKYRDAGHPKYWGPIIGSSTDAENADWLAAKFKAIGLSDVRIQPLDLPPRWIPQEPWDVSVTAGGKTIQLDSAQPDYESPGTPAGGLDVEAVYVGLGSEADFVGKDVRGKAVFSFNQIGLKSEGAVRRAAAKGAAVAFEVDMLPGNMRYQAYPSGTKIPAFTVGSDDGYAARDMIAAASVGGPAPARVKVNLRVETVPGLKSALVWGTLPGATDETIYIEAHRDGWFDASGDNAAGVASMIGLAEYYAKIPQAKRQRTIVFVGLDGHHNNSGGVGRLWMVKNRATLFEKTALFINIEHPAYVQTNVRPRYQENRNIVWANTSVAMQWYAGGPSRPELQAIAVKAFQEFGVPIYAEPNQAAPAGDGGPFWRILPTFAASEFYHYFHTDQETPETIPWTGLEAATRAHAKIIDEVNKLPLSTFKRPDEPAPAPRPPTP